MKSVIENQDGTFTIDGKVYGLLTEATKPSNADTKESFFAEVCKDLERKEDREKYPNSVFWFNKHRQFMFEHDEKNNYFWCSYKRVWSVFESKFGMNYSEIQAFMNGKVEEHFKCKGVTTPSGGQTMLCLVEEHFKCKGVTTQLLRQPHRVWWRSISNARE